jgi:hypothetical protein
VTNPGGIPDSLEKQSQTNRVRYGTDYAIQNPEIFRTRYLPNFYQTKQLALPSGRVINFQGYEDRCINHLLKSFKEDEIMFGGELSFPYTLGRDKHTYYPDLGIRTKQIALEVKSQYTFDCAMKDGTLVQKLLAVQSHGWLPVVQIWDDEIPVTLLLEDLIED